MRKSRDSHRCTVRIVAPSVHDLRYQGHCRLSLKEKETKLSINHINGTCFGVMTSISQKISWIKTKKKVHFKDVKIRKLVLQGMAGVMTSDVSEYLTCTIWHLIPPSIILTCHCAASSVAGVAGVDDLRSFRIGT